MKKSKLNFSLLFCLLGIFLLPNNTFAQDDKKVNKKVIIVKKTIDKDGNESVEKTITEGYDIDVDKLIKSAKDEKGNVEIEVEVTSDEMADDSKKERTVTVEVDGDEMKIVEDGEVEIIKIDKENGKQVITTDDGKKIIVITKEGSDNVNEILEDVDIDVEDGSRKEIRIMKIENHSEVDEDAAFFGVMIDPSAEGMELLNVVEGSPAEKVGLKRGDILKSINDQPISSYKELTEILSKFKPNDSIKVTYKRDGKISTTNAKLVRRGDLPSTKKMMWKTSGGELIEIEEDKELHFHDDSKKEKVKKEKIIIKKKIKE